MNSELEEIENLEKYVKQAMKQLYDKDKILLNDNVSERCLVYNFARHLERTLKETPYKNLYIDLEYNRNCGRMKSIKGQRTSYPDLIVHERGTYNNNAIVIEFKKWNNKSKKVLKKDREKLKAFKYEYGYRMPMLVIFHKENIDKVIYENI